MGYTIRIQRNYPEFYVDIPFCVAGHIFTANLFFSF